MILIILSRFFLHFIFSGNRSKRNNDPDVAVDKRGRRELTRRLQW